MPDWSEILDEINASDPERPGAIDSIRQKYLQNLANYTERNILGFYSGWLQKPRMRSPHFSISDDVMPGFMTAVNKLDKSKGLDLILHTPGGEVPATEQIVFYLRKVFNNNVRAIVPQLAMSAGTMIALACKSILMGLHSNLGPIDPQVYGGIAAHGVLEEFERIQHQFAESPKEAQA